MVSKACDSQESPGSSAALIPPWAAFECERTGWTLEMMPTEAPSSAAARAARWPARPAPMTRTSCWGISSEAAAILCERPRATRATSSAGRPQRPPHLVDRDHAAQPALGVDGHHRAESLERVEPEQRLERLVEADPEAAA